MGSTTEGGIVEVVVEVGFETGSEGMICWMVSVGSWAGEVGRDDVDILWIDYSCQRRDF